MIPHLKKITSQRHRAFTMVETVLALGITSFALVTIMGILPCGLQVFHSATEATVEGQMVQQIVGKLNQTPYDDFSKLQESYSFDDAGNFVEDQSQDGIYTANLDLNYQTELPGSVGNTSDGLTGVTITFKRKGDTGPVRASKTFVAYIDAKTSIKH